MPPSASLSPAVMPRLLVVEDNPFQRAVLVAALGALGLREVAQAANGIAALNLLRRSERGYDLAICDLQMDGMDGIEFMRHAAQTSLGGVILLSAVGTDLLSSAEAIASAHGLPVVGTICKPVDPSMLRRLILDTDLPAARARRAPVTAAHQTDWTEAELKTALQQGEFVPYFQPKIHLATGAVAGAEVLVRWQHPQLGILPPSRFIAQMEELGLIGELTDNLFHQALASLKEWGKGSANCGIAINASALTLQDVETPNRLLAIARGRGVAPARVTIELTETMLANDGDRLHETLARLRMSGFGISLDDFGTGFSSLQQLGRIPFTELKIDQSFVTDAQQNSRMVTILDSIAALARSLRIRTVAEGIESEEDLDFIRALGCDLGQGYLFSRPLSHHDWTCWLAQRHALPAHRPASSRFEDEAPSLKLEAEES